MTWKDTLRKAPFNIGEAQVRRNYDLVAARTELLNHFPKVLEEYLDEELRREIRDNPNEESYTVYVKELESELRNLRNNGIPLQEILKLMEKEYNAQKVTINDKGGIKFEGIITL